MTIKNINDLKKIQIVCKILEQIKDCLNYLKQLGFDVEDEKEYKSNIIFWRNNSKKFITKDVIVRNFPVEYYNKQLVKTLQKFIKEKEEKEKINEKKEKIEDFEVAEDGRIIKINNWNSDKYLYFIARWDYIIIGFTNFDRKDIDYYVNLGLAFISREARDKAIFKMEIETKLKNISERLNNGRKINFEDGCEDKYYIYYDYENSINFCNTCCPSQGTIHCLDENFLKVAKKEIGENNLIKYFTE